MSAYPQEPARPAADDFAEGSASRSREADDSSKSRIRNMVLSQREALSKQ